MTENTQEKLASDGSAHYSETSRETVSFPVEAARKPAGEPDCTGANGEKIEASTRSTQSSMPQPATQNNRRTNRLPTGVDELDEQLNGGPRPGTLATLQAPPASQTGPLFYSMMRQRPTTYITTVRREDDVRDELDHVLGENYEYTVVEAGSMNPIRNVNTAIEEHDAQYGEQERNIIIDSVDALERTGKYNRYVDLLKAIKSYLLQTGGLAVLHCTSQKPTTQLRTETLNISGLVLNLDIVVDKNNVENHLTVPKVRGQSGVDEVIKLKLGTEVEVDTSRNL